MIKYQKFYNIGGYNLKMDIKIYEINQKKGVSVNCKKLKHFLVFDLNEDQSIDEKIIKHFTNDLELMYINNPEYAKIILGDCDKINRKHESELILIESPDPNDNESFMIGTIAN
tara:strand:+ start:559 stop:900 length:342 start_codon:yes stop_codon:yes gene_type:complete